MDALPGAAPPLLDPPATQAVPPAVASAIRTMRRYLGEPLTVDDLARSAMFSKFHFSRVFCRATGVSPGRFLAALRLEEAKRLLLTTDDTVTDIGQRVGYSSPGTFSTRFCGRVGLPPVVYRRLDGYAPDVPGTSHAGARSGTVRGTVRGPADMEDVAVFLGVFPSPIPQGQPVACTVRRGRGVFVLPHVPPGHWHLAAHSAPAGAPGDRPQPLTWRGTIVSRPDGAGPGPEVELGAPKLTDPPLLLALPDLGWTTGAAVRAAG